MITTNLTDLPRLPQEVAYCLEINLKSPMLLPLSWHLGRREYVEGCVLNILLSIRLAIGIASLCQRYSDLAIDIN